MDAHLFRRFCEAAEPLLVGSRIEKLQEAGPGLLVLSLYGNGQKRQLCLRHDRKEPFCFFAASRLTAGAAPSAAIMRLRKYAVGRRIAALVPQFWQRRLWLLLAGNAEKEGGALPAGFALWLLLDLREGASLHFQPPEGAERGASALPLPPEPDAPQWPGPAQLQDALGHWRDWPVLTPALRRSLAHMEEPDQWALMEDLRAGGGDVFLYSQTGAPDVVRAASAWPLPPELRAGLVEESGEDVLALTERAAASLVLGRLAAAGEAERAKPVQRRLRKVGKLLEKLDEEERRLKAMTSRQADALALSANLWRWQADARAEWVEVPDETSGDGEPRRIRLDARHDIRANMERLFHAAKRGKRGLEMLEPRRAALLEEAAGVRQALGEGGEALPAAAGGEAATPAAPVGARIIPRELPKRVQAFVSEDGFLLLRGRDARGNQALLRKAAPGDIWLHAEGGPGAHVLIRRAHAGQEVPERTLQQAGCLAASKSWRRDAASARILYAEARHVRPLRGAAPGTVRMDKILATREVAVDPELENRLVHS
ncbi:MAG: DUF814 domain-containing protein [Desulfovibrio sp.]|uniref:NFACT RNA binding domain-containing protein n=1 Tax=Desulfovibrio sp. TaxID=885 RepID=UPI001A77D3D7|nr:NFACT RNA binding domain-containing protein [Desulfovibrio sp.]MBD5417034.1 DUF814 domain-containing protein [Desulfovibrio sp.]